MSSSELRANARQALTGTYWMALLATFLIAVISGAASGLASQIVSAVSGIFNATTSISTAALSKMDSPEEILAAYWASSSILVSIISSCVNFAIAVFVTNTLTVGQSKFFLNNRVGRTELTDIFNGFAGNNYLNIVKTNFFKDLYIFLWSLLFIIPGIIKTYEYAMVPYILAERPDMDKDEVLKLSKELMDGNKMDLFILQLSFIGWILLSILVCCGLGSFFLTPYMQAAETEFFCYVRSRAEAKGIYF